MHPGVQAAPETVAQLGYKILSDVASPLAPYLTVFLASSSSTSSNTASTANNTSNAGTGAGANANSTSLEENTNTNAGAQGQGSGQGSAQSSRPQTSGAATNASAYYNAPGGYGQQYYMMNSGQNHAQAAALIPQNLGTTTLHLLPRWTLPVVLSPASPTSSLVPSSVVLAAVSTVATNDSVNGGANGGLQINTSVGTNGSAPTTPRGVPASTQPQPPTHAPPSSTTTTSQALPRPYQPHRSHSLTLSQLPWLLQRPLAQSLPVLSTLGNLGTHPLLVTLTQGSREVLGHKQVASVQLESYPAHYDQWQVRGRTNSA